MPPLRHCWRPLNAGAIDCGGVGDAPFAFARAAGVRAKIIAATRSSGASTALLVPATSKAQTFADLKGRTIGTGKGSVGHFLVLVAREKAGLSANDINLAFLSPADAKAAFVSGAIDAWSTWGPMSISPPTRTTPASCRTGRG